MKSGIQLEHLSKNQSDIIKGISILLIIFHNFLHITSSSPGENEMQLDPQRIHRIFDYLSQNYILIITTLASYLGHYGVQLFIFISGYGLTKQYAKRKSNSYWKYIIPRVAKLYSLLIFGIILYLMLFWGEHTLSWVKSFIVSTLLMYNNLSFSRIFSFVGPWWYFSLALQLYLIFPFLYYIVEKYSIKGLLTAIALSYVLIYLLLPLETSHQFPIFGNFTGHLPEFLLGIGLAHIKSIRISVPIIILALTVFILSNFFMLFFPFSFFSITILWLSLFYGLYKNTDGKIRVILCWLGEISIFAFVINGPLRAFTIPIISSNSQLEVLSVSIIHFGLVIIAAFIMSLIYNKLISPPLNKLVQKIIS